MTNPFANILAINAFHGGSHREFLEGVVKHSKHDWQVVAGKPVHWKWRMRSAPLEMAAAARATIDQHGYPDIVFCTDMLDLPQWRGLLRDERILRTPTVIYFHENQFTYPRSPDARVDFHYGYTNLLSALAADECWFNSAFHRRDFLGAAEKFIARMPDAKKVHCFEQLATKCQVMPPGFDPPDQLPPKVTNRDRPVTIGWVSRWEHDKRPDRFAELLAILDADGVDFRLVLLGGRPRQPSVSLLQIQQRFGSRIRHDGWVESNDEYWRQLQGIDVVVSTADHEFFGIAICEAIWAGSVPALPNRLSYPELVPTSCCYDSLDEAAKIIRRCCDVNVRAKLAGDAKASIAPFRMNLIAATIDQAITRLV